MESPSGTFFSKKEWVFLFCIFVGVIVFIILDFSIWLPERQAEKREEELRVFHETFGVKLPPPEVRKTAQPAVIEKLLEMRQRRSAASEKEEDISSSWTETPVTPEGVTERLGIQQEYDKAAGEKKEASKKFRETCRVAQGAGFNEEARAVDCPR